MLKPDTYKFDFSPTMSIGKAFMVNGDRKRVLIGEVFEAHGVFELALFVLPISGHIELAFDISLNNMRKDLTAILLGRHDTYEFPIGSVDLKGKVGTVRIDGIPMHGDSPLQLVF